MTVPEGLRLRLDPRTRVLDAGRALLSPTGRLLRLGPHGPAAVAALVRGEGPAAARDLGRTLLDAGAAHPVPDPHPLDDVTVVIPVRDRPLDRTLAALGGVDVLVVDDGSVDGAAVRRACAEHGARYVRRDNGGPAAARNTALPELGKPVIAFVDSDCRVSSLALQQLVGHLRDPAVGAVAPRVMGGRRSPLDLGRRPALVRPGGQVAYVPTACLVIRRSAMTAFDEQLRYGEDVDLVWRTLDAGWQVRYDPTVVVHHDEPPGPARMLRRFHYGTSAAPLSQRHPERLAHLVLPPLPTAVLALLLLRRPALALAVAAAGASRVDRAVRSPLLSAALMGRSVEGTARGMGGFLSLLGPLAWLAAARDRRVALLLVLPWLEEWAREGSVDPATWTAGALLDQAAYGAGVLSGCVRHRTVRPLLPRWR